MRVSMIIPIYNEGKIIDGFLAQLDKLAGDWEIIFADGGSTDGTLESIENRYTVLSCPKGRANQMNHAAKQATGDVLWFVHSDSRLPQNPYAELKEAVENGAKWGCFHIGFDYKGPFMRCNTFFSNRRVRKTSIAFGDQGIYVKRDVFLEHGGFPALPIMEDYEFSRQMRAKGIPLVQLKGRIITSGRRYENTFPPVTMWKMFYLRCLFRAGVDVDEIARRYKDIR